MIFKEISKDKVPYELLILGDSDERCIAKYFDDSIYWGALETNKIVGMLALKKLDSSSVEIMNIAVDEVWQKKRIGSRLIEKALSYAKKQYFKRVIIRTGNAGLSQLSLYQKMGFRMKAIISDYFTENYADPIYENNIPCFDQIVLELELFSKEELEKKVQDYWKSFIALHEEYKNCFYEAWSFGYGHYQANNLLGLVRQGIKRGTSSAYDLYKKEEHRPEKGDISIITYGNGVPGCIVKNTNVKIIPFSQMTEKDASLEGEGDLSLTYWKRFHEQFFKEEYAVEKCIFNQDIPVLFEEFKLIWN